MDSRLREISVYIRRTSLLAPSDMAYMDSVIATLVRLRDGFFPELTVLALTTLHISRSYRGFVDTTTWMGQKTGVEYHFTAAGRYGFLVSVPLWNFLLGLVLWRWILWTIIAFHLSRRSLRLVVTHPDKRGGLGFLCLTVYAFAPIAFATTSVIASTWHRGILAHGAHVMEFRLSAIIFALTILLIALGPLLFFVPRLIMLRRRGILEYGILGQMHSSDYHEKWIVHRAGHEAEFLQAQETNTLATYGRAFENIDQLRPFPAGCKPREAVCLKPRVASGRPPGGHPVEVIRKLCRQDDDCRSYLPQEDFGWSYHKLSSYEISEYFQNVGRHTCIIPK